MRPAEHLQVHDAVLTMQFLESEPLRAGRQPVPSPQEVPCKVGHVGGTLTRWTRAPSRRTQPPAGLTVARDYGFSRSALKAAPLKPVAPLSAGATPHCTGMGCGEEGSRTSTSPSAAASSAFEGVATARREIAEA